MYKRKKMNYEAKGNSMYCNLCVTRSLKSIVMVETDNIVKTLLDKKENHTYDRIERAHHPLSMLFDVEATVPQTHVDHYCE